MIAKGLQANSGLGFKGFMGVHDLNFNLHICDALGFEQPVPAIAAIQPGDDTVAKR